jgi:putative oxidoreductase
MGTGVEREVKPAAQAKVTTRDSGSAASAGMGWLGLGGWIELGLRLTLGGLFVYSGGMKLLDPAAFQSEIINFNLVSHWFAGWVAAYLPWLEVLCGAALVVRRQLWGSLAILSGLMVLFIFFVGSAWWRDLDVTCGCFGASDTTTSYPIWIGRNILILCGLLIIGWLSRAGPEGMPPARADRG